MLKENDSLVQVKICGLTSMDDVHIIEKYGADYAGMVLYYPKSRRNIDISLAETLATRLKKSDIKTVAVVVSPDVSQLEAIQNAGFDYIQIHGELSDDVYNACSVGVIRAVNIKHQSEEDIYMETKRWRSLDKIYGLLFDILTLSLHFSQKSFTTPLVNVMSQFHQLFTMYIKNQFIFSNFKFFTRKI